MTKRRRRVFPFVAGMLAVGALLMAAQDKPPVQGVVVFKSTENGVSNAEVIYTAAGRPVQKTRTNAAGEFTFKTRELGIVTVSHPGFATAHRRWPPASGNRVVIHLEPPAVVSGTLVDSDSLERLAGSITVSVERPPHQSVSTTVEVGTDGTFTVENLPSGSATLFAVADGNAPTVKTFTLDAGQVWMEHVRLPPVVLLKGRVLDAYGKPVAGAEVAWEYPMAKSGGILAGFVGGRVFTDSDGMFLLTNLRRYETLWVWAEHDNQKTAVVTVILDPLSQLEIELRFK